MDRKGKRQKIDKALKNIIVPFLREKGFKGSMPHFRREQSDRINLLTFQHSLYDTKFVIEIANCPVNGVRTSWGKEIPKNRVTAHDMGYRLRIGSERHKTDYWFDYGKESLFSDTYKNVTKEIIELWVEAENWWQNNPGYPECSVLYKYIIVRKVVLRLCLSTKLVRVCCFTPLLVLCASKVTGKYTSNRQQSPAPPPHP